MFPEVAEPTLPRAAGAPGPDRHLTCSFSVLGVACRYKIIPQTDASPTPGVLYYLAWDPERRRSVFAISPDRLDDFGAKVERYYQAAEMFYGLTNTVSIHEINASRVLQMLLSRDYAGVIRQLGTSWLDALQDPLWWLQTATAVAATGAAGVPASKARVLARRAGQDAATRGYGSVAVGAHGASDHIWSRIEVSGSEVTYRVTSISAVADAKAGTVAAAGQSLSRSVHREMLIQAAWNARRIGLNQFVLYGEQAGPNFVNHAKNLATSAGVSGNVRMVGGPLNNCEVRLRVDKILGLNGELTKKMDLTLWGTAAGSNAERSADDRQE